jgi:hypothetical protein
MLEKMAFSDIHDAKPKASRSVDSVLRIRVGAFLEAQPAAY